MSRIFFKNNPYPNGHKIKEFIWSGRLKKDKGLLFDFHLVSDDYYAEDDSELDDEEEKKKPDWQSKIAWGNFHNCTMSSTYWNGKGVLVARKEKKLDFSKLLGETLIIDPLPEANNDLRDLSFGLYLLGHDSCANHKISFTKQYDKSTFDIEWKGNVALSYAGDNEFKYSFEAVKNKVKFDGINMDKALTKKENEALLKMCVVDSSIFELVGNTFQLKRG